MPFPKHQSPLVRYEGPTFQTPDESVEPEPVQKKEKRSWWALVPILIIAGIAVYLFFRSVDGRYH